MGMGRSFYCEPCDHRFHVYEGMGFEGKTVMICMECKRIEWMSGADIRNKIKCFCGGEWSTDTLHHAECKKCRTPVKDLQELEWFLWD